MRNESLTEYRNRKFREWFRRFDAERRRLEVKRCVERFAQMRIDANTIDIL